MRKERDFNNTLIQASPAFFGAISADYKTIMMNEAMLRALGYTLEEIVGKHYLTTFVPESEHKMLSKIFEKLVKLKEPTLNENHILTKDCRQLLVEWYGRPVFKENGEYDFFFGVGIDITERKQAEKRMEHLNLLLRAIRSANQLIAREKNRNRLIKGLCERLIETRGYYIAPGLLLWTKMVDL